MILSFQTDRSGQTVQSDGDLHCLPLSLHLLVSLLYGKATLFKFQGDLYSKYFGCPNFYSIVAWLP